jgi:hypothetical protein
MYDRFTNQLDTSCLIPERRLNSPGFNRQNTSDEKIYCNDLLSRIRVGK